MPERTPALISRVGQFVYFPIPKAASTTIKYYMADLAGLPSNMRTHGELNDYFSCDKILPHEYFKFSFVRHPLSRLASVFLCNPRLVQAKFGSAVTFRRFIERLALDCFGNRHWAPQSWLLAGAPVDFIGKTERFRADWRYVTERVNGATTTLARQGGWHLAAAPTKPLVCSADTPLPELLQLRDRVLETAPWPRRFPLHWTNLYDAELLKTAHAIYADDIATFGYTPSITELACVLNADLAKKSDV